MTNGGGPHGPKARKHAPAKKPASEKARVSARRKNWVPEGLAREAARKGSDGK